MNPQIMFMTAMAAASFIFIGYLAYRIVDPYRRPPPFDFDLLARLTLEDHSSLDEDLKDIMAFVPLNEIRVILETYMKYDSQIADTVSFINDQKRFIQREFERMPEWVKLIDMLRRNRLDVDGIRNRIRYYWKTSPRFVKCEPKLANGGLTVMINNILNTIPTNELHELLQQKVRYSASFCWFICALDSKEYHEFCVALEKNDVLHHHYFWAKEGGLEITFAIELYNELHTYLTRLRDV